MAGNHSGYMGAAPDLSGSISKNRFRVELLWGVEKLLQLLDRGLDSFAVVFDYRCDVELHLEKGYEFYQVKTGKTGTFGVSWACRTTQKKPTSIIGKLFELSDASEDGPVRLVIVGNRPFSKKGGRFDVPGELLFSSLDDDDKRKIEEAVIKECGNMIPDLSSASYLLVAMDLDKPGDSIKGHLVSSYEAIMGCEPRKPNALYDALRGLVIERACNERRQPTYDDVISKKGITAEEARGLFEQYKDEEDTIQDVVLKWIKELPPLQQNPLLVALEEITTSLDSDSTNDIVDSAKAAIRDLDTSLSFDQIIEQVAPQVEQRYAPEMSESLSRVYSAIAIAEIIKKG